MTLNAGDHGGSSCPSDEGVALRVLDVFGQDGVIEKTGPALGIAFADQLVHGWDVARSSGQDDTMPQGLAEAAYEVIHGRFTDEQRKGVFKPEIPLSNGSTPQQRLLADTGRPSVIPNGRTG